MSNFNTRVLDIDTEKVTGHISDTVREQVFEKLKKRGLVVAVSGGIDSSVTAAISVRAVGKENMILLALPERDSNPESLDLAKMLADHLGLDLQIEDIAPVLEAFGCYSRRDEAVKRVFPEYTSDYKMKIVLPQNLMDTGRMNVFHLVIESPDGKRSSSRIPRNEFLQIMSATNHKQRTRTQFCYYYADCNNYAVAGTPNRLEYDQGFFVKGGDGLADLKPIAHLYKTQVYALAEYLGLPAEILSQKPTTDTYSLGQTQEEFFFSLPYDKLDIIMWALNHSINPAEVAKVMGYTEEQINRVYSDILQKRRATEYLHHKALLVEPIPEIDF